MVLSSQEKARRGKELEPARSRGRELFMVNPQVGPAELRSLLKGEGLEANINTCGTWLVRWRAQSGIERQDHTPTQRARELRPAKERAFEHWRANPLLTGRDLVYILENDGLVQRGTLKQDTVSGWVFGWNHGRGYAKKPPATLQTPVQQAVVSPPVTWEQIVSSAPSIEALGVLLLEGVLAKIDEGEKKLAEQINESEKKLAELKDQSKTLERNNKQLIEDMKKLQSDFNERLARAKIGTLTLDTAQHRLFRKE